MSMPSPLRQQNNPLESSVSTIECNRNYLTPDLISRLVKILPKVEDTMPEPSNSLDSILTKLGRMVHRLEEKTRDADTSPAEIKSAVMAAKDLFKLMADYGQEVSSEKKAEVLKRTIIETLHDTDKGLKEKFMSLWEERLKQAASE